jgi:hypothetical protein
MSFVFSGPDHPQRIVHRAGRNLAAKEIYR